MSRMSKTFRVSFDRKGRNLFRMFLPDREVRFQLSPNRPYYFDATDRENSILLINMVSDNQEGSTRREYEGSWEARQAMHLLGFPSEQ